MRQRIVASWRVNSFTNWTVADQWVLILKPSTVVVTVTDLAHWNAEWPLAIRTAVKLCQVVTASCNTSEINYRISYKYITVKTLAICPWATFTTVKVQLFWATGAILPDILTGTTTEAHWDWSQHTASIPVCLTGGITGTLNTDFSPWHTPLSINKWDSLYLTLGSSSITILLFM